MPFRSPQDSDIHTRTPRRQWHSVFSISKTDILLPLWLKRPPSSAWKVNLSNLACELGNPWLSLCHGFSWLWDVFARFYHIMWHVCTLKFIQVWNQLSTLLNLDRINALGDLTLGIKWWQLQWYMTLPVVKKLLPSSSDIIGSKVKSLPFRSLLVLFCFRTALYQWSRRTIIIQNCTLILDQRCIQSNLSINIFKAGIKFLDGRTSLGSRNDDTKVLWEYIGEF